MRGHADIVQHSAACATQRSGGSGDVRVEAGARDEWRNGRGEECGSSWLETDRLPS